MRILYFHQHFSTRTGSAGTRSYEMARALVARGHQVTMVCGAYYRARSGLEGASPFGVRRGDVDGIQVIELAIPYSNHDGFSKRALTFSWFAIRATAIALFSRYDLLFATSTPLTIGIPGIVARLLRRKRFVFEVRDLWPELPRQMGLIPNRLVLKLLEALEWACYHAADSCIALSPGMRDGIMRRGIDGGRISLVPNGSDLELFMPSVSPDHEERRAETLSRFGIPPSSFVAVYAGEHGLANGLDALLDAAAVLKSRKRDDISILFIGDGKVKEKLLARCRAQGLDRCVFSPPVPKLELAEILPRLDLGLMVLANKPGFYFGTSPNKFFDYIASGIPVLNNYPGWVAGMIDSSRCGLVCAPEAPEAFASALESLADRREECREMGRNGRILAEREFSRELLAKRFVEALEKARAEESPR